MGEIIIKFLNIATIKFIGNDEMITAIKKYYVGLEVKNEKADYTIELNKKILPKDINIPRDAIFKRCFAGPHYYCWKDNNYNLSYSPPEERGGSHLVIRKGNQFQVSFHEGESPYQIVGISREILKKEALSKGYMPIHASVISKDNKGYVFFGAKNKGKSTSLFSSVIFNNAKPMSNDFALLKKEDAGWKVIGWPWTVTINQSYFDLINRKHINNIQSNGKIKYYPKDFCEEFNTQWIWKQSLYSLINVDLNSNLRASIEDISPNELEKRLETYGRDVSWRWNDVFGLGDIKPVYDYEHLSKAVKGKLFSGDIIQFFKCRAEFER